MAIDESRHHKWNHHEQGGVEGKMNFMHQEMFASGLRATYDTFSKLSAITVKIKQGQDHHGNHRSNPGNQ